MTRPTPTDLAWEAVERMIEQALADAQKIIEQKDAEIEGLKRKCAELAFIVYGHNRDLPESPLQAEVKRLTEMLVRVGAIMPAPPSKASPEA